MGAFFDVSPLGGVLGAKTCSIFRLDKLTGTIPLEPLLDIVPGITPMRVTLDMIDDEQIEHTYTVTSHALQDVTDASSNVHRQLRTMSITGTLSSNLPLPIALPIPVQALPNPLGLLRIDLIRLRNLQQIADDREPVMVVTPRYAMARAFIESVRRSWKPDDGDSSSVTIRFKEALIVKPSVGAPAANDYTAQLPGNNAPIGGGQGAATTSTVTPVASGTPGVPPAV